MLSYDFTREMRLSYNCPNNISTIKSFRALFIHDIIHTILQPLVVCSYKYLERYLVHIIQN